MPDGARPDPNPEWREHLSGKSIFHRYVAPTPDGEAVRVLAIDGGGIRGIVPTLIAVELEERSGKPLAELFDFIVGTSTGSLLALGAAMPGSDGRPKLTAQEGVDLYAHRGHEFFSKPRFSTGVLHEKYLHEPLEHLLSEVWGTTRLSEAVVDCLVTSYDLDLGKVRHFDSRQASKDPASDLEMKAILRAATAAPTYFTPARAPAGEGVPHLLIDGAVYANNPAMIAFTEAQRAGPTDVILVSLGCGEAIEEPNWDRVDDWGLAEWARPILNVVFDGASEAADYELRHLLGPERYHRFQVPLTTANHRIDDASPENIDKLQVDTARMITERAAEIDEVTEKLAR